MCLDEGGLIICNSATNDEDECKRVILMVMKLRMTGRNQDDFNDRDDFSDEDYDRKNKQITAITAVHLGSVKLRVLGDPPGSIP